MKVKSKDIASAITNYLKNHGFEQFAPKAVLFDMDGVLYDSMPNHVVAWQQSMDSFGIHMTADDAYATEGARGIDTIRQMVAAQQHRDISLEEAQRMYDEKTRRFHEMPKPKVMPGIPELMQQIKDCGLSIGVVTGSGQRPLFNRLLTDFAGYLDEQHITTAYDVSIGKPAPDPYLMGMKRAGGVAPWQTIVVENAPLGVRAGVAARAFTIAVNTGPLPDKILAEAGASLVLGDMYELNSLWQQLSPITKRQTPPPVGGG